MLVFTGCCPHCDSDRGFAAFGFSLYAITERDFSGMPLKDRQILAEKSKESAVSEKHLPGMSRQRVKLLPSGLGDRNAAVLGEPSRTSTGPNR